MKELKQWICITAIAFIAVFAVFMIVHPHVAEVSCSEHGTISEDGTVRFHSGLFLGIDPDEGFSPVIYVDNEPVEYDGNGTFLYRTSVFDLDTHEIYVEFVRSAYLSVSHNDGGTVTPDGTVLSTGDVRIIAVPDDGYVIDDVIVNGESIGSVNIIDLCVDKPYEVKVVFRETVPEDPEITVDVSVDIAVSTFMLMSMNHDFGTIIPSGTMRVPYNGSLVVSVILNPGYEMRDLLVDGISKGSVIEYRVDNITGNISIVAMIDKIVDPGEEYTIDIVSGEGGTTDPNGSVTVSKGEDLTIKFVPNNGYRLSKLIIDGSEIAVSGDSYTIRNITKNMSVQAFFEQIPEKKLIGIDIVKLPVKTEYVVGNVPDITGIEVVAMYSDGSSVKIPESDLSVSPNKFDAAGNQKVTIEYGGFTDSYSVTVYSVDQVFSVTVVSFGGQSVNKRLSDFPIKIEAFEPGAAKELVMKISSKYDCKAVLSFTPSSYDKELTDRISVSLDGRTIGSLTELFSLDTPLGTLSGESQTTLVFSFPPGDDDNQALNKKASFVLAVKADIDA